MSTQQPSVIILILIIIVLTFVCHVSSATTEINLSNYLKSTLHTNYIKNDNNYAILSDSPLFVFYWQKDTIMFNGSVVSEFETKQDETRVIGLSLAVPNLIVERSSIPMRYIVDVMIFNNSTAYDMYYKTNNTNDDLTGFSTSEIFKNAKLDYLDGGLSNIVITSNYELTCAGKENCIVNVIEFSRLKNTTDVEHDVFLPSKKNERGIMFLNFATWTSSNSENVLSNIVFSNVGYGWFEFQSIYYYPVTATLQGLRITHGILMLIGFSLILVASMIVVRHSGRFSMKIKGIAVHIVLSIIGVVCIVIAFILSLIACSLTTNRHFDSIHKWIGLFVFLALILYQVMLTGPLTAIFHFFYRKKGNQQVVNGRSTEQESFLKKSTNFKKISKQISSFSHIWGGRIIVLAGILNLYFGVHGIYATSEWFIGMSVYLLVILCCVIFAELFSGKTFRRIMKGKFRKVFRSK